MMDLMGSQTDTRRQDVHSSAVEVFLRSSYFVVLQLIYRLRQKKNIINSTCIFFKFSYYLILRTYLVALDLLLFVSI